MGLLVLLADDGCSGGGDGGCGGGGGGSCCVGGLGSFYIYI